MRRWRGLRPFGRSCGWRCSGRRRSVRAWGRRWGGGGGGVGGGVFLRGVWGNLSGGVNFWGGFAPPSLLTPHDSRSICTASLDASGDPSEAVTAVKALGAPVVFSCHAGKLQWWKQTTGDPQLLGNVERAHIGNFFEQHRVDFSPPRIFEGK